jgi:hypothetical protein
VADRPIIFSGSMVRALLAGTKTQTRRVLSRLSGMGAVTEFGWSDTPGYIWHFRDREARWHDLRHEELLARLPYAVGDRLYVRERCLTITGRTYRGVRYIADGHDAGDFDKARDAGEWDCKSRPSIHMPRWASRLTLAVTEVRVERLNDISRDDAMAEGVVQTWGDFRGNPPAWALRPGEDDPCFYDNRTSVENFRLLWESINGPDAWAANPWVVAISFRVIPANIDSLPEYPHAG